MKLIYSNENILLVTNMKNLIKSAGIEVIIRNEYAHGAIGEISAFDTWPELWLVKESDLAAANAIVESSKQQSNSQWQCPNCQEFNADSFELCWQCQQEKS